MTQIHQLGIPLIQNKENNDKHLSSHQQMFINDLKKYYRELDKTSYEQQMYKFKGKTTYSYTSIISFGGRMPACSQDLSMPIDDFINKLEDAKHQILRIIKKITKMTNTKTLIDIMNNLSAEEKEFYNFITKDGIKCSTTNIFNIDSKLLQKNDTDK